MVIVAQHGVEEKLWWSISPPIRHRWRHAKMWIEIDMTKPAETHALTHIVAPLSPKKKPTKKKVQKETVPFNLVILPEKSLF